MAELAVTDGMPPPADLPRGEVWATQLEDGRIRINRADPRILISAEVLIGAFLSPEVMELDLTGQDPESSPLGALLKIRGVNRTVIYRITEYVPRVNGYIAEWPD